MSAIPRDAPPDAAVLAAFDLAADTVRPAASGLINRTWHVASASGAPLVLQRVNAIFPGEVNEDIDRLTRHIAAKGLTTPRVVRTRDQRLWLEHGGHVWRVLTAIPGVTHDALESPRQAREAGRALATFHRAVADYPHAFENARLGVHDTARHLASLRRVLAEHGGHAQIGAVAPLAEEVLRRAADLATLPPAADRVVHGDPKISNILFDARTDEAVCLIDLDTLSRMPVALELGDAMRSWCNPAREDAGAARLSLPLFEAAVAGYAEAADGLLEEAEWRTIPDATATITLELAARFCADALAERYFRWDAARYAGASEHNQARTRGQLLLGASIEAQKPALHAAVARAFGRA